MRLLLLSLSVLIATSTSSEHDGDPFGYEDEECVGAVSERVSLSVSAEALSLAMNRGLWRCAKEIARLASEARIDVKGVFDLETRTINKEISLLKGVIESNLPMNTINPAFQWAQSGNDVFLNVKFAHKLDAPATLNVEAQNVTLEPQSLALRASDGRKLFVLDIELLKEIVPEESSWSMASVGRMTITLKKKDSPTKWARLTKGRKKPSNIHFWFEIHEKYSTELEKLNDEENDDEESSTPTSTANQPADKEKEKEKEKPIKGRKKTKKDKRIEKLEDEKDIVAKEWLKTRLGEIETRVKEKKQEVDEECRLKKSQIEKDAEKEKEEIRQEYAEKIRKFEDPPTSRIGPDLGPGEEEL